MEVMPGYRQTEVGIIPEGWDVKRLGDLFEITSSKRVFQSDWRSQGVPFYRARELAVLSESGTVNNELFITQKLYDAYKRTYGVPDVGDILVTGVGTLGKVYVVAGDHEFYFKDGNIIWFKIAGSVLSEFLRQLYLTPLITKQIADGAAGTTVGTYTISGAKKTTIPFPPLPEQRSIASALSDVDALIDTLSHVIAKKRHLKQAALQQLLTCKIRLPGFDTDWKTKRFSELAAPRKERFDSRRSDIQEFCIELEQIEQTTGKLLGNSNTGENSSLKSVFREGDILFGKLRAYLRKYWLADRSGVCSTEIWVFEPNLRLVTASYLFQLIKMDQFIQTASMAYGTHMPRSDWNVVKNFESQLPPLPEQKAIGEVLSDMDSEIAKLEQHLEKTRSLKVGMMQELLTGKTRLV